MRPTVVKELQIGYLALGVVVVVTLLALALIFDWGAGEEDLAAEVDSYGNRTGPVLLDQQNRDLQAANQALAKRIGDLQGKVGIRAVPPFFFSDKTQNQRVLFRAILDQLRDKLGTDAKVRGIAFDDKMGFGAVFGRLLNDRENVRDYLTMLQLVTKAVFLAMHSPDQKITSIKVTPLPAGGMLQQVRLEGPREHGAPLLREYRFQLEVKGWLSDLLWLKHRLAVDEPPTPEHEELRKFLERLDEFVRAKHPNEYDSATRAGTVGNDISPLVVTGEKISCDNKAQHDGVSELTLVIELAGLEFLNDSVDWEGKPRAAGSRPPPTGVSSSGGTRSSGGGRVTAIP